MQQRKSREVDFCTFVDFLVAQKSYRFLRNKTGLLHVKNGLRCSGRMFAERRNGSARAVESIMKLSPCVSWHHNSCTHPSCTCRRSGLLAWMVKMQCTQTPTSKTGRYFSRCTSTMHTQYVFSSCSYLFGRLARTSHESPRPSFALPSSDGRASRGPC